jgi:hypothetical protein
MSDVKAQLECMFNTGEWFELCGMFPPEPGQSKKIIKRAYLQVGDWAGFNQALAQLGAESCPNYYVITSPVKPEIAQERGSAVTRGIRTGDDEVVIQRMLLIDVDAKKPDAFGRFPSTDAEHADALRVRDQVKAWLSSQGWPEPALVIDSGNGGGLLYRVDLPVAENRWARAALRSIAAQFKDVPAEFDTSTYNSAQLTRLLGSQNCRGYPASPPADRPWRVAKIDAPPGAVVVVPREALERVAKVAPEEVGGDSHSPDQDAGCLSTEDLAGLLSQLDPTRFRHHSDWLDVGMASWHATEGSSEGLKAFIAWSTQDPVYGHAAGVIAARWPTWNWRGEPRPVTVRTLVHLVRKAAGNVPEDIRRKVYAAQEEKQNEAARDVINSTLGSISTRDEVANLLADEGKLEMLAQAGRRVPEHFESVLMKVGGTWGLGKPASLLKKAVMGRIAQLPAKASALSDDDRPVIYDEPGETPEMMERAEAILMEAGCDYYQQGTRLVRLERLPMGGVLLTDLVPGWLLTRMERHIRFIRIKKGQEVKAGAPQRMGRYLDNSGSWKVPALKGVVHAPTLRDDFSVLQDPGYDAQSRLICEPSGAFPPIPDAPTRADALEALQVLSSPFAKFPFESGADRSVVLAACLTGLVRPILGAAPLFAIDAPCAGTGKSLIAETVGIIISGRLPAMMNDGGDEAELGKRLNTALVEGRPVIVIDNVSRNLGGDALCSTLTQEELTIRILGETRSATIPTLVTVLATGNNLTVAGDASRRVLICRIDAGVEQPDARPAFPFDPRDVARSKRGELVAAGLTILRAYIAANRPRSLAPIGSFERWNVVREALVWLGCEDPAKTRARVKEQDPQAADLAELLAAWWEVYGDKVKTAADACSDTYQTVLPEYIRLGDALKAIAESPKFSANDLGRSLSKHVGRPAGGLILQRLRKGNRGIPWRVVEVHAAATAALGIVPLTEEELYDLEIEEYERAQREAREAEREAILSELTAEELDEIGELGQL